MHIHWRRVAFRLGTNEYRACRCGSREIRDVGRYGRSPQDRRWIETGELTPKPVSPPPGRGGASRSRRTMEAPPDMSWVTFDWIGP